MIKKFCVAFLLLLLTAVGYGAPLDVTGTWAPKYWTLRISLHQRGDDVVGTGGAKDFWFRGHWDAGRLILVANNFNLLRKSGPCTPRGTFVLNGKTVSSLTGLWLREPEKPIKGP